MAGKELYNTTDNDEGYEYRSDDYESNKQSGNVPIDPPTNQTAFPTVISNPKKGIRVAGGKSEFVISPDDYDRYAQGFVGNSYAELNKYKQDSQSGWSKGFNAVVGGTLSGIGTFVEDIGYMTDLDTYKAIFTDIDQSATKELGVWDYLNPSKAMQMLGREIKESTNENMPIYERPGESLGQQVFNWNNFKGIIDSVVGFALAGAGAGKIVQGVTKIGLETLAKAGRWSEVALQGSKLKALPKVANWIEKQAYKAARVEEYAKFMAETEGKYGSIQIGGKQYLGISGDNLKALTSSVLTKGAEARMEGLESFETSMANMEPLIRAGVLTRDEAILKANREANDTFESTMALFATDMIALKGLFKNKASIFKPELDNPLAMSTKAKSLARHLLGTPKEGIEEMWQESAKMEGMYDIYQDIKGRMSYDDKLQYINRIGFDPDKAPESFVARTAYLFDTTQARVAGLTGMISGPLQSAFVMSAGRTADKISGRDTGLQRKQAISNYKQQQSVYKNNEALFGAINGFTEKVKSYANGKELEKLAVSLNDEELHDIAQEAQFVNIVAENFVKGSTNQLREVISSNKENTQSSNLLRMLDTFEKDFSSSKRYINSMEVFLKKREIQTQDKLKDMFLRKAESNEITPEDKKAYIQGANKAQEKIAELQETLTKVTDKKYQVNLAKQYEEGNKLSEIYNNLGNINSATEIDKLLTKYPDDPEILRRKESLKLESKAKQTAPKEKTTLKNKVNETLNTVKDTAKNIVDKIQEKTGQKVQESTLEGQDFLTTEEIEKGREVVNGQKITANKQMVPTRKMLDHFVKEFYTKFNEQNEVAVEPSESDKRTFAERFNEGIDDIKTFEEVNAFTNKLVKDIYLTSAIQKSDAIPVVETAPGLSETKEAAKDLINLLSMEKALEDGDVPADEAGPTSEEFNQMSKTQRDRVITNALYDVLDKADKEGLNLRSDFKTFIKYFADLDSQIADLHYNRLEALFNFTTGSKVNYKTLQDALGITISDSVIEPEMVTVTSLAQFQKEFTNLWINPKVNSEDLQDIYLDESIQSSDKKNEFPVTSFAYLSQDWWFRYTDDKTVTKETAGTKVDANPLLNPAKFNTGSKINFRLDDKYTDDKSVITLNNGKKVNWLQFLEDYKESVDSWRKEYELGKNELITDYWPITISTEEDGVVAHVHNVNWINKLNVLDSIKDSSRLILREFKKNLYKRLTENGNNPIEGVVAEKVIEITKDGYPKGFVNNSTNLSGEASKQLPDSKLQFIQVIKGTIHAPGTRDVNAETILNIDHLPNFGSHMTYVVTPIGIKNKKMMYWAHPMFNKRLEKTQVNAVSEAIKIFTSDNRVAYNEEFYQAYLDRGIDLKTRDGLHDLLKQLVYIYNSKKSQRTIEEFVRAKAATKPVPVIELQYDKSTKSNKILIGKGDIYTFEKGVPNLKQLEYVTKNIISDMLFNIGKDSINSTEDINFVGVNDDGSIEEFNGKYNDLVKQNSTTFANSTLLRDGSYGYTIQHITRFDMNIQEQVKEKVEQSQQPKTESTNYRTMPKVISAYNSLNKTYEEFYDEYLSKIGDSITLQDILDLATINATDNKDSNESNFGSNEIICD